MENKKRDVFWNLIGVSINSFSSLFFMITINHINTKSEAGIFTYAYSLICLFYVFAIFYNRVYQIEKSDEYNPLDFVCSRVITGVLTLILVLLFSCINSYSLYKISIIMFICLFRVIESISDSIYGIMQKNDSLYLSGISLTLKGIIGITSFIIIDLLTKNIIYSLVSLIIVNLIIFFIFDIYKSKKYIKNIIDKKNIKKILIGSIPIFIYTFLSVYVSNASKYILDYFDTAEIQNIYGIIFMPSTMIGICSNYIVIPFITTLNKLKSENKISELEKCVNKIMIYLIIIGILALICGLTIGIPVLNIFYNMNLNTYKNLLLLILLGATFYTISTVYSQVLVIFNENKIQVYIYGIMLIITTILSIIFISNYKINGAVYSYLISMFILLIIYYIVFYKTIKKKRCNNGEKN